MTLRIESLSLRNFRNYEDAALNELGDITVLVGENAVGKTNLIEAISCLRRSRRSDMVRLIS